MTVTLISILIPTYNRCEWLAEALQTAIHQKYGPALTHEIVVVDNDSNDDTRDVIAAAASDSPVPVKYVHSTRRGDAKARNDGLSYCDGEWIAFMDDDELADPDWLANLWAVADERGAQLVGGAVYLDATDEELSRVSLDVRRSLRERSPHTCRGDVRPFDAREFPGTDNLFISREALTRLQRFDETVLSGSADYDFSVRARRAGFACWFAPDAKVVHRVPANRLTQEFIDWDSFRSGVMLAFYDNKYGGKPRLLRWAALRSLQAGCVTLPRAFVSRLANDPLAAADARVRWRRFLGYASGFSTLVAPWIFARESLDKRIDFARGRVIGRSAAAPATNTPVQRPSGPPARKEAAV